MDINITDVDSGITHNDREWYSSTVDCGLFC